MRRRVSWRRRPEKWCQRMGRVDRKRFLGRHDIYHVLARESPWGWDPNAPGLTTGALGGHILKPRNMRRTGRTQRLTPAERFYRQRAKLRDELQVIRMMIEDLKRSA